MIKNSPFQGFSVKDLKVFANVEGVKYYYKMNKLPLVIELEKIYPSFVETSPISTPENISYYYPNTSIHSELEAFAEKMMNEDVHNSSIKDQKNQKNCMKKSSIKGKSMKEMYRAGLFDKKTNISDTLEDFNLSDLKSFAQAEGIPEYYKLNKINLIKALNSLDLSESNPIRDNLYDYTKNELREIALGYGIKGHTSLNKDGLVVKIIECDNGTYVFPKIENKKKLRLKK